MALEASDHGAQTGFARAKSDILHQQSHEIGRQRERDRGWLIVDSGKGNSEHCGDGGRLPCVDIGPKVQGAVGLLLGEQIHARLTL